MFISKNYVDFGGTIYWFEKIDTMPRTKENAYYHGIAMFCRSWTFDRMTEREQINCLSAFDFAMEQGIIKGTFSDRIQVMNAVYNAYLMGIGYSGMHWRNNAVSA